MDRWIVTLQAVLEFHVVGPQADRAGQRGLHEHVTAGQVPLPQGFTLLTPPETIVITVGISRASVGAGTDNEELQPTEAPEGP